MIPCHNYGTFLAEAIGSALAQTYSSREIVIVDDGSTDDSSEVARSFAGDVRLLSLENRGVERAFNEGVREAAGDYVVRLDADDVLEPTYVEELFEAMRRSPEASFAYCRARMFGARTGLMRCFPFSAFLLIRRTNYVNASALVARAAFLEVGGYSEDLGRHANEDWDLWLKMVENGLRGTYIRAPLLRWRRHVDGSRNPESGASLEESIAAIRSRHQALYDTVSSGRGALAYVLDLVIAAADVAFGLSRWPRLSRKLEKRSWKRFQDLRT